MHIRRKRATRVLCVMMAATAWCGGWAAGQALRRSEAWPAAGFSSVTVPGPAAGPGMPPAEAGARPDLRPQIAGPVQARAGQDISAAIHLRIANMGEVAAAAGFSIEIGLLMVPEEGPAMYHALVRLASPYPLAPHETRQYRIEGATIPENFQWGTNRYRLCARVDPANRLGAVDRRNGIACTEILVLPERGAGEAA